MVFILIVASVSLCLNASFNERPMGVRDKFMNYFLPWVVDKNGPEQDIKQLHETIEMQRRLLAKQAKDIAQLQKQQDSMPTVGNIGDLIKELGE